jgi:ASC-1-like (ASCH) protein
MLQLTPEQKALLREKASDWAVSLREKIKDKKASRETPAVKIKVGDCIIFQNSRWQVIGKKIKLYIVELDIQTTDREMFAQTIAFKKDCNIRKLIPTPPERYLQLYNQGYTPYEIAKRYCVSTIAVREELETAGIDFSSPNNGKIAFRRLDTGEVYESLAAASRASGISPPTISKSASTGKPSKGIKWEKLTGHKNKIDC